MFKKLLMVCFVLFISLSMPSFTVMASSNVSDGDINDIYTVTLNDGTFLFERTNVEVGDIYINSDFHEYIVVSVDDILKTGIAEFNRLIVPPKVDINYSPVPVKAIDKTICMYSTHNDESYITGDGVDSVYGKGGIHDVAKQLKSEFKKLGIDTIYDETLHIPHDTSAYTRSSTTAKALIKEYSPNAIFDIHRDGASRSTYVTKYNGKDVCKVRMVIGKGNSNNSVNQEFAVYLLSVAKELHPWLFLDIYLGKGHYNQSLSNKAILFEMGSHLVEKELVLNSVAPLAEVINVALFGTTVTDEGNAIIGGNTNANPTVDEYFDNENIRESESKSNNGSLLLTFGITLIVVSAVIVTTYITLKKYNDNTLIK